MKVLLVNGDRYLINDESPVCDKQCAKILNRYPIDAVVDFVKPVKHLDYRTV